MDYQIPPYMNLAPAYLLIGPCQQSLTEKVIVWIQNYLCPKSGCNKCRICQRIREQQHARVVWLKPEKQYYTLNCLSSIFDTIIFQQALNEHTFFVIQSAHMLSDVCAHALLKSIEEPPAGYHFLFLTSYIQSILPTITSRCLILNYHNTIPQAEHPLVSFFMQSYFDPEQFLNLISSLTIDIHETNQALNTLLAYYTRRYLETREMKYHRYTDIFLSFIRRKPMPGTEKLVWQTLFFIISEELS